MPPSAAPAAPFHRAGHAASTVEARRIFDTSQRAAVKGICYASFLASEHFTYILELKAKEGIVPGLPDFRLSRVLGQGGFGQVHETARRPGGVNSPQAHDCPSPGA